MKVYIRKGFDNEIQNHNFFLAFDGFKQMGFEIKFFKNVTEIVDNNREDIIVGFVDDVRSTLAKEGIVTPELDYPKELKEYLGRKVWRSRLNYIANNPENWNVFIKPVEDKRFTGVVVRSTKDLIGCGTVNEDPEIWCSDIVNIVAEWRCFVSYGRIIDIKRYKGHWKYNLDTKLVEKVVLEYTTAPNGYSIDFALTDKGETILIEVNDGYALGSYGLGSIEYSKLLSARWAELTNTVDECNF